jgi:glycosyltransferase involved in cell wall biosynthesis
MKLLHIIASLEIGGAQRLLSDLIPIQKKQGLTVNLLVNFKVENNFAKKITDAGVEIISLDEYNLYKLSNVLKIRKIIKHYDVVHVHLFPSIYWVAIASVGLNVKLVYTEHSTTNKRRDKVFFRPIEKFIYKRYDRIISISEQTQLTLQKWLYCYDNRFVVINNGVDIESFSKVKSEVSPKSLIMISRFVPSKNQETVIRALKLLDSDVILRLVGDGENLENCKLLAKQEGVENRVLFLGKCSNVVELISESYIGIQSSNWEGFGLTAVELMAAGKPVVASDVDGLKQVVDGAGLIFKRGNERDLAKCIRSLLENQSYYNFVSQKCKERASLYDITLMSDKYKYVYYELTKN